MEATMREGRRMDAAGFAALGQGKVAYVKAMTAEEVVSLFPEAPRMAPGATMFALLSADGKPIVLAGTREAAVANAWQNDLKTVGLH
jgi:hypothetical protein